MAIGEEIRELRKRRAVTLRAAAGAAGVSPSLMSRIERGELTPSRDLVMRLAEILEADSDRWCASIEQIPPDLERRILQQAKPDGHFFRQMRGDLAG